MFIDELRGELSCLQKILKEAEKDISSAPPGALRISKSNNNTQYYHRQNPQDKHGKYIAVENISTVKALAQKHYAQEVKKQITNKINDLISLIKKYEGAGFESIADNYVPERRKLITPYRLSDAEFTRKWLDTPYVSNPSHPENKKFKTLNGELVRSKSEQIIADRLAMLGIPYKYEAPYFYSGENCIYPDFTILNVKKRKLIYLEHFGKMDSDNYRKKFFWKMKLFNQIGLIQGDNLLMTFEDADNQFDVSAYDALIKENCIN